MYFGLRYFEARIVAPILILVALARWIMSKNVNGVASRMHQANIVIAASTILALAAVLTNAQIFLEYYPLCMNIAMFIMFFGSILRPPTVVEQIARLTNPTFSEDAVPYTRKVTMVWCGFFVFNGSMSFLSVHLNNLALWALYNGFVSYVIMALLFVGEYLVRRRIVNV